MAITTGAERRGFVTNRSRVCGFGRYFKPISVIHQPIRARIPANPMLIHDFFVPFSSSVSQRARASVKPSVMRLHRIGPLILSAWLVLPSASALRGLTQGDTIYATSFSNGCEKILTNECLVHCAQEYKLTMMGSDCNGIKFVSQKTASDVAGCTSCPVLELDSTLSKSTCDSTGMGATDIMFDGDQHQPVDQSSFSVSDGSYILSFEPPTSSTCICSMMFSETKPSSAVAIPATHCVASNADIPGASLGIILATVFTVLLVLAEH